VAFINCNSSGDLFGSVIVDSVDAGAVKVNISVIKKPRAKIMISEFMVI
jgi:hypothetical protein